MQPCCDFFLKGAGWVIHYAQKQLLKPTLPLQTQSEAGGILRPKIKDNKML